MPFELAGYHRVFDLELGLEPVRVVFRQVGSLRDSGVTRPLTLFF